MNERTVSAELPAQQLESFVLCVALGTLEAMRARAWPLEAGIWTLGRASFWEPLRKAGLPKDLLRVLAQADEWDALERLSGTAVADRCLDRHILFLRKRLAGLPPKEAWWRATWKAAAARRSARKKRPLKQAASTRRVLTSPRSNR